MKYKKFYNKKNLIKNFLNLMNFFHNNNLINYNNNNNLNNRIKIN